MESCWWIDQDHLYMFSFESGVDFVFSEDLLVPVSGRGVYVLGIHKFIQDG